MSAGLLAVGAAGGLLILFVLVDIFITLFGYDGFTFFAGRYHRALWAVLRAGTRPLPERMRHAVLSLGSAALLPATLVLWLGLETAGFAMIYLPGLANGGLSSKAGTGPEAAFYLSGGDLTSLTFGDIVARTAFYRAMVDVETMIGLATFTLALTYVLTAFDSLARLRALYARVRRNTIHPNRPATILERRYRSGDPSALTAFLSATVEDLEAYVEGLRRFPVVFYFHTRRTARSTPRIFATLGEVVELIRWGLPAGEPPVEDPTLLALMDSYHSALERLRRSFVGPHPLPGVEVPDLAAFTSQLDDPQTPAGRFRELQRTASRAADLPEPAVGGAGQEQECARFRRWWEFHRHRELLLARVAAALGY